MSPRSLRQIVILLVALVGFHGPLCSLACAAHSDPATGLALGTRKADAPASAGSKSPEADSAAEPEMAGAASHAGCHGGEAGSAPTPERSQHDCETRCGVSALLPANDGLTPIAQVPFALVPTSVALARVAPGRNQGFPSPRREPPLHRNILLMKSSLQI